MYECLCCGLKTLPTEAENAIAFIWPVCWWENDVFIKSDNEPSDENRGMTLNQARANYKRCGIANPQFITERVDRLDIGWRDIVKDLSKNAKTFEIHCWNEETEWIELALKYGTVKEDSWKLGKVISGDITEEFINMLINLPRPTDTEIYYKRTPFFSIFFDNGFSSEHYGTEINFDEC